MLKEKYASFTTRTPTETHVVATHTARNTNGIRPPAQMPFHKGKNEGGLYECQQVKQPILPGMRKKFSGWE